ncbi:uncharacterized protein PV06_07591 [Exophiala oligosperma]|uniref:CFEM domain-containing protein n=2 Tax=Chaetothyriales TaxID=34395 RepID=A0A0D2DBA4_9EURO|nr:uncharacterized protein PV06_07591 [Exophiala oligosperma]KAJ9625362.1 hypothetical protein H2204_010454 [Knufia peltigerae]KIW40388.1 hypothetical protein PV06_07591 [Exophiala oligosperma]
MRTSLIVLALAAASQAARVPLCSAICMTNGIAATGCSASDTTCICGSDKFLPSVAECAESDCNGDSQALQTAEGFCSSAGVKVEMKRWLNGGPGGHGPPEGFKGHGPPGGWKGHGPPEGWKGHGLPEFKDWEGGWGRWGGRWKGGRWRGGKWRGGKWGGRPGWWSPPSGGNSDNGGSSNNGGSGSQPQPAWGDWQPAPPSQGGNGGSPPNNNEHGGWPGPWGPPRGGDNDHHGGWPGPWGPPGGDNNNGGSPPNNGGSPPNNGNGGWSDWQPSPGNHHPHPTGPWNPPHTVI